jgi:hypothetical protein
MKIAESGSESGSEYGTISPLVRGMDPQIRIRTKTSRIRKTFRIVQTFSEHVLLKIEAGSNPFCFLQQDFLFEELSMDRAVQNFQFSKNYRLS